MDQLPIGWGRLLVSEELHMAQVKQWSPGIAAVLSLVIPGAGQMYKGQVANGLVWFIATIAGYVIFPFLGLAMHVFCIIGAGMGKPPADPDAPTPETHVRCPDCRELIRKDARKCKHCGCALIPID